MFRTAEYQRTCSWTEEQRYDLFDDIEHASPPDCSEFREHFMATIVIRATGKKIRDGMDEYRVCHVVDGQQRLTTLVLLLRAIAQALDRDKPEEAAVRERLESLLVKSGPACPVLLQTNHDFSRYFFNYIKEGNSCEPSAA